MKSTCIKHPANEPLIIIRQWQLDFCKTEDGKTLVEAAALMSYFEYWHNVKLSMLPKNKQMNEVAKLHDDESNYDTTLLQWHSQDELIEGIMGIVKSRKTLKKSIDFLAKKGVITKHKNPNPRLQFDQLTFYLFHPEICQAWIEKKPQEADKQRKGKNTQCNMQKYPMQSENMPNAKDKNTHCREKKYALQRENIPTPSINTENTSETSSSTSSSPKQKNSEIEKRGGGGGNFSEINSETKTNFDNKIFSDWEKQFGIPCPGNNVQKAGFMIEFDSKEKIKFPLKFWNNTEVPRNWKPSHQRKNLKLSEGMKIQWTNGKIYKLGESGELKGLEGVPVGTIRKKILNGNAQIVT